MNLSIVEFHGILQISCNSKHFFNATEFRWILLKFAFYRDKVPSNSVQSTKWNDKTNYHFNIVLLFEWLFLILPNSHQNTLYDMDLSIMTLLFICRHTCVYCVWLRYIVREPRCWKYISLVFLLRIRASTWATFQYPIRRLIVRSREVLKPRDWCLELSDHSELYRHPGSTAAEAPVKCQSDAIIQATNLAVSRLHEILRY